MPPRGQTPPVVGTITGNNDFNASDLIKQVDDHERDMADIAKRVATLENKIGTHEKLGDTLCGAIERDTKIHNKIEAIFAKLVTSNDKMKEAITDIVNKSDRDWLSMYGKRLMHLIWSLLMIAVGVAITITVENMLHSKAPAANTLSTGQIRELIKPPEQP